MMNNRSTGSRVTVKSRRSGGWIGIESLECRQLLSAVASTSGLSARDTAWIKHSDSSDALEVALGNLSQTHASSTQVKAAGARMVTDHSTSMQLLETDAASMGVTVTGTLNAEDQATLNRLSKFNGTAFDEAYSTYMVSDHKQDIASYTAENRTTSNATLKAFTATELPILQTHLSLWLDAELTPADVAWVAKSASSDMLEVRLGTLAQTNATSTQVKSAGQRMVTDHTASSALLAQDAAALGLTLPSTLNAEDQAVYNRLARQTGTAFDKAYATYMVSDHRKDIASYTAENRKTSNATLKAFTSTELPILQLHLSLWETTVQSLRATA